MMNTKQLTDYIERVHLAARDDHIRMMDEIRKRDDRCKATMIESLRLMRDTTQSQAQHDRAVEALKYYGRN